MWWIALKQQKGWMQRNKTLKFICIHTMVTDCTVSEVDVIQFVCSWWCHIPGIALLYILNTETHTCPIDPMFSCDVLYFLPVSYRNLPVQRDDRQTDDYICYTGAQLLLRRPHNVTQLKWWKVGEILGEKHASTGMSDSDKSENLNLWATFL